MSRQVFLLPDLGEGLTEAELVRWLVAVGDAVAVDAPVAEVETAKAVVEVPSPYAGVVGELHGVAGEVLTVGEPLISVDALIPVETPVPGDPLVPGEVGASPDQEPLAAAAATAYVEEERAGSGNVLIGYGTSADAASGHGGRRARRRTAPSGPARPAPAAAPTRTERPRVVSPVVRDLARRTGVDLAGLQGSGPGGVIVRRDVEEAVRPAPEPVAAQDAAAPAPAAPAPAASAAPAAVPAPAAAPAPATAPAGTDPRTGLAVREVVPLTGLRRTVARALARSRSEIPEATTWVDVDVTDLLALRTQLSTPEQRGPGLLALVGRFVVAGLARFPELNARVDVEGEQVVLLDGVNLGIAAQTPRGLVVPAVRDAHRMGARQLDAEIKRLTVAARDGRATAAELSGGSFTLNNYGVLGVDGSAAIINHPEVAILGMGRVVLKPWVVDGAVVPRSMTQLSLVFDHRVCDGGTAGGFLRFVADCVERPLSAFADL